MQTPYSPNSSRSWGGSWPGACDRSPLIGLLIALLGQSREDDRLRRAEAWRQQAAKKERLRDEFATALLLVYSISVDTGIFR